MEKPGLSDSFLIHSLFSKTTQSSQPSGDFRGLLKAAIVQHFTFYTSKPRILLSTPQVCSGSPVADSQLPGRVSLRRAHIINLPWRNRGNIRKLPFAYTQIDSLFTGGSAVNDKMYKKEISRSNSESIMLGEKRKKKRKRKEKKNGNTEFSPNVTDSLSENNWNNNTPFHLTFHLQININTYPTARQKHHSNFSHRISLWTKDFQRLCKIDQNRNLNQTRDRSDERYEQLNVSKSICFTSV